VRSFEYAILRVVPRVEREELINAGAIVYCRELDYLRARAALDEARLRALFPSVDVPSLEAALGAVVRVAAGDPGAGPIARLDAAERFRWLVAPRSTVLQTSPVHVGLCDDPDAALDRLIASMVAL
jgi:hypothetical protein